MRPRVRGGRDRAARFGNTSKAYKDDAWRNYVLFKPGYTVKISGGTVLWTEPVQDGAALEGVYTVDEGAKSVTIELVKSTGKFEIKTPEGVALEDVVNWADLIDSPDPETWATASWLSNLLEVSDIFPGMGIDLAISPEYELADLDEDLLVATGFQSLNSGEPARYYNIKTPDTGDLKLTVKAATDSIPVRLQGEKDAVHCDTDTDHTHPGSELTIYVKPGYYVQATGSVFDFLGEIDDEGCNVYRLHVLSSAESVTVTAVKAAGKLTIEGEATAFRDAWMDNEDVFMSDPTKGLAPGATVTVTVANGYAVEFDKGAEDPKGSYHWIQNDPDSDYFGQLVFDYYCTAPASGDVTAKIVLGETAAFVPVEIVDPESAVIYTACAGGAVPGQQYMNAWLSDADSMTVYYDYDVYATGKNPVVKVEDGYITATVVNKAGADFQFTNMDATQMEDGTWKLYTWDLVYMIVEDGYELEVDGATYWDTVTDESTGDIVRIYALDVGAENITITVKKSASAPEKDGWQWENGGWHYYVDSDSEQLKDSWVTDGGKKYYVDGKGVMVNAKWKYIDGCYYSFKANGEMRRGEWLYDGGWYLLGADGAMMTGLQKVELGRPDDGLYYFNDEHNGSYGCVLTGLQGADGATYYFNPKHDGFYGRAYTDGTYEIEGANYVFDSEGKCLGWYM